MGAQTLDQRLETLRVRRVCTPGRRHHLARAVFTRLKLTNETDRGDCIYPRARLDLDHDTRTQAIEGGWFGDLDFPSIAAVMQNQMANA
jgi:hypothetical protein